MEIKCEAKTQTAYREIARQSSKTQTGSENVVPDTKDDIGRIVTLQTGVLLKSKESTGHGVLVSGEVEATLLYINEMETCVSSLRTLLPFRLEYELDSAELDLKSTVMLRVTKSEARILNPRKVAITVEVSGELSCYLREEICAGLDFCQTEEIHVLRQEREQAVVNAVCEKSFAITEQFVFRLAQGAVKELLSKRVEYQILDKQLIGSKVLVKGKAELSVWYLSERVNYPLCETFSAAFSQLIDLGEEKMDFCSIRLETSSLYASITDTIEGEQAMDVEIHAVLQLVGSCASKLAYLADAYSNLHPLKLCFEEREVLSLPERKELKLTAVDRFELAAECERILAVFTSLGAPELTNGAVTEHLELDVLYSNDQDGLGCCHRSMTLQGEAAEQTWNLVTPLFQDVKTELNGSELSASAAVTVGMEGQAGERLALLTGVELSEEASFDYDGAANLTALRSGDQSAWELAKQYHSSEELIYQWNDWDGETKGVLLLIPKCP